SPFKRYPRFSICSDSSLSHQISFFCSSIVIASAAKQSRVVYLLLISIFLKQFAYCRLSFVRPLSAVSFGDFGSAQSPKKDAAAIGAITLPGDLFTVLFNHRAHRAKSKILVPASKFLALSS